MMASINRNYNVEIEPSYMQHESRDQGVRVIENCVIDYQILSEFLYSTRKRNVPTTGLRRQGIHLDCSRAHHTSPKQALALVAQPSAPNFQLHRL